MSTALVSQKGHTHYISNGAPCWCGWKLIIPPVCFSLDIEVKGKTIVSEAFNCFSLDDVADRLREIADSIDRGQA